MERADRPDADRHGIAWTRFVAGALGALLTLGCASTSPPNLPPAKTAELYRVGASDELTVRVLPDPAIERVVTVRPDGRFSFDLIGDVEASGRTTDEIAADITQRSASPSTARARASASRSMTR
jgi:polysaccharide biosynthesis/export protein